MADNSAIEWTDATWNPIRGCTRVSPGCGGPGPHGGCYAERIAARFSGPGKAFEGVAEMRGGKPRWTGKLAFVEGALDLPLRWRRPRRIFVNSMSDLFHEAVPDEWIDRIFAVMVLAPQHTFQVLTKRSARMRAYLSSDRRHDVSAAACGIADGAPDLFKARAAVKASGVPVGIVADPLGGRWPLSNVWLGVSAEDQRRADERVPDLLATPAAVRFVSAEPLLGPIDFLRWLMIDWIVVGGESGPNSRPMHPTWARAIRDQCAAAGVAFHFKQWGAWSDTHPDWPRAVPTVMANDGTLYSPGDLAYPDGARRGEALRANHDRAQLTSIYRIGKKAAGRLLDGRTHDGMPEIRACG